MKLTKFIALFMAVALLGMLFVGCNPETPVVGTPTDEYSGKTHAEISDAIYAEVLGKFTEYYNQALEAETISERYALMAIAEAKLLESGVMLPSSAKGGNYAISRVAPYSITSVLWGNDSDRFHDAIIVKGNPIKVSERNEMKAKWAELKGTGTYEKWAKDYLTGKGYTLNDEYALGYTSDPQTWDAFNTYRAADSEAIVNTYDGLVEYDIENVLKPALAESYTVSEDGLTYTFKIRQGVKWVDSQGKEIETLTAKSFVAGMQHMLDAKGGLEYLVSGIIVNADEYMAGTVTDFSQVGVKATDDYTLVYTLAAPCSYFVTMLGYNIFAPLSETYFLAKGGAFGVEAYKAAAEKTETYTYGTTPNDIAYCGPYLVTSYTAENSIVFDANPAYWDAANINIKKISWTFISGSDPTEAYTKMKDEIFAGSGLNTNSIAKAKEDGLFDDYAYVSSTDATSYPVFFNLHRQQYANFNDATIAVSTMTDDQKLATNIAMLNQHFRLALATSIDRAAYNGTKVGEDIATNSLVNSYTPGTFVTLTEDVTVKINGTDTTFKAGTFYGAIMQAQIDADGIKIKAFDATADGGVGSSAGYDGWYNASYAAEQLELAIDELKGKGLDISATNPIYIDMPYYDVSEVYTNAANAIKQSVETALKGCVIVNLVKTGGSNYLNWYNAGYYPEAGNEMNYTITDVCGWGPDYGDPATYLNTMLPQAGGMAKNIGLY